MLGKIKLFSLCRGETKLAINEQPLKLLHNGERKFLIESDLNKGILGIEIKQCREPRAFLNSPVAPSNFCKASKDVLVSIHNT